MKVKIIATLVVGTLLWTGCGSDESKNSSKSSRDSGSFTELWQQTLSNCARNCHQPDLNPEGGPDFSTKDSFYKNTVGKIPTDDDSQFSRSLPPGCRLLQFIEPGHPERSLIAGVISSTIHQSMELNLNCSPGFSNHAGHAGMPDANQQSLILAWIKAGAPYN